MTSYINAATRGREAAHDTNTRHKMVTLVEHRREYVNGWARDTYIASCGHTIDAQYRMTDEYAKQQVSRRRRCHNCPADPPKPLRRDHCRYGIFTEFGERPCPTLARFIDTDGYGLLCGRHHTHLLVGGYLDRHVRRSRRRPPNCLPRPHRRNRLGCRHPFGVICSSSSNSPEKDEPGQWSPPLCRPGLNGMELPSCLSPTVPRSRPSAPPPTTTTTRTARSYAAASRTATSATPSTKPGPSSTSSAYW